jgi:diguanylate cyclase (GGDEF)-like protein
MQKTGGQSELAHLAGVLRSDAWEISRDWSDSCGVERPHLVVQHGDDDLNRFGEIPAFVAALAHELEAWSGGKEGPVRPSDELRLAAAAHAHLRVQQGYDQRDLLCEFVVLRRVLWQHVAVIREKHADTLQGERIVNALLDRVLLETADRFVSELTEELARRAERDALTGLLNRQAFSERLSRELSRAKRYGHPLTVVVIDLDAFKEVNDELGHLTGDAVLTHISSLLMTHTRDEDAVGRLGGDEFAVALVEAGIDAAHELIRRLRIHLVPARRQLRLPRKFGASFGAASFPTQGDTVEKLLFAADARMYRAKGPGRGARMEEAGYAPRVERARVLVADDDAGVRDLCSSILEGEGFAVDTAADGEQAIERALANPPDLVLLDIRMPKGDGWQVAKALAADPRTQQVPIVLMTGRADSELLDRAVEAGARDFVHKPFEPAQLSQVVHDALEQVEEIRREAV